MQADCNRITAQTVACGQALVAVKQLQLLGGAASGYVLQACHRYRMETLSWHMSPLWLLSKYFRFKPNSLSVSQETCLQQLCNHFCSRKSSRQTCIPEAMVEITTRVEASFSKGKAVALPDHLLVEHEGNRFLKIRPTSPAICKLLLESAPSKNPSFSTSPALAELLNKRNEAALQEHQEETTEQKEDLWCAAAPEEESGTKKRKRVGAVEESYTVQIDCDGVPITCLVSGQRPGRSDLAVCLDPVQLTAVFRKIQPDLASCFAASKRTYSKRNA